MKPGEEFHLYRTNRIAWVAHLIVKYMPRKRFGEVWRALDRALTEEEKEAARQARNDAKT